MPRIPLLDFYVEKFGAETGHFADWEVPMRFTSSIEEHMAVRNSAGVFDVSHMGRLVLRGSDVIEFIQRVYTRDLSRVKDMYMSGPALILTEHARVRDDEMLYRINENEWLVVVNAPARIKILSLFEQLIKSWRLEVKIEDLTEKYAMIALQGPQSPELMEKLGANWAVDLKPLEFGLNVTISDIPVYLVSRSGWTGEDGYEIWADPPNIQKLFSKLVELGAKPCGIIARDSLRLEMGYVLYGNEYGEDPVKYPCAVSLRYGMGAITWSKHGFIGEEALRACRREGVRWVRLGIKMAKRAGRVIPRSGDKVYVEDILVGWVTSGGFSPILSRGIAQAYIDTRYAIIGEEVEVEIRGKKYPAKIVDFPFILK
ncbi:MAG: glycine cleavage system aminomethyltransferase GcvT [Thermoprotei archaeon]